MKSEPWPNPYAAAAPVPLRDNDGLREAATHNADFWQARPELQSIYANSRRLLTSPWALLGVGIIRAIHSIPWNVRYQSFMGTASLNTMLVLVGDSGGGKSFMNGRLDECLPFLGGSYAPLFRQIEIGSGESIAETFAHTAEKDGIDRDGNPYARGDLVWHSRDRSAMFGFDEIGRMFKMQVRDGSTVYEYIKQGWSGSVLGRKLVGNRGVMLPSDSYRMTMIANAQPDRCGPMFTEDEIAGGFPGRLLWMETRDPSVLTEHDETPCVPHGVKHIDWRGIHAIQSIPEMDALHRADRLRYHEGKRSPLEGHEVLLRAKVACALMRLNNRAELNYEDWELAGVVMSEGIRVRTKVQQKLTNNVVSEDRRRGESAARQALAAEEASETIRIKRICDRLREFQSQGMPENLWRRNLRSTDRQHYDVARASLQEQ